MVFLRKYNVTLDTSTAGSFRIRIPIRKAGSADFATSSDWTPAAGDVKVSKDGGAQANIGTLPSYANGSWEFTLTGTELSAKVVEVRVVDSATKAVDDEYFNIETFGHSSAMWSEDHAAAVTQTGDSYARLGAPTGASVSADIAVIDGNVDDIETLLAAGPLEANVKEINDTALTGTGVSGDEWGPA